MAVKPYFRQTSRVMMDSIAHCFEFKTKEQVELTHSFVDRTLGLSLLLFGYRSLLERRQVLDHVSQFFDTHDLLQISGHQ